MWLLRKKYDQNKAYTHLYILRKPIFHKTYWESKTMLDFLLFINPLLLQNKIILWLDSYAHIPLILKQVILIIPVKWNKAHLNPMIVHLKIFKNNKNHICSKNTKNKTIYIYLLLIIVLIIIINLNNFKFVFYKILKIPLVTF